MGRKFFVTNCRSGCKGDSENISMFSPPKDDQLLCQWRANIPRKDRALSRADSVCAKHFEKDCIITEWANDAVTVSNSTPCILYQINLLI